MLKCKVLLIFFVAITVVAGQIPLKNDTCPDISKCIAEYKYDASAFQGYYYFYAVTPLFFQDSWTCSNIYYSGINNNLLNFETDAYDTQLGRRINSKGSKVVFPNGTLDINYSKFNLPLKMQVIASTPEFLITYACYKCGPFSKDGAGIYVETLTRLHAPSCKTVDAIRAKFVECGIPKDQLIMVDNLNCNSCDDNCSAANKIIKDFSPLILKLITDFIKQQLGMRSDDVNGRDMGGDEVELIAELKEYIKSEILDKEKLSEKDAEVLAELVKPDKVSSKVSVDEFDVMFWKCFIKIVIQVNLAP